MTTFVNLTPHAINIIDQNGQEHTFPASGEVARVSSSMEEISPIGEFSVARQSFGKVEGLPAPQEGTFYIVSGLVLAHCGHRGDVVAPRTDGTAVRNDKGHIIAVRGFVAP